MIAKMLGQLLFPDDDGGEPVQANPSSGSAAPFQQAADTIRSTAKWLVTAFAGVGGILIAGIPLTGLGKLSSSRLLVAAIAIGVALAAIAYIIPLVSHVFTAKYITLADLAYQGFPESTSKFAYWRVTRRLNPIMKAIVESRDELYGAEARDLAELNARITKVNERLRADSADERVMRQRTSAGRRDVSRRASSQRSAAIAEQSSLAAAAERVVAFANYEDVRGTFKGLYGPMAAAAAVVACGVVLFAYVVGSTPSQVDVTSPTPVVLSLTSKAADWVKMLGPTCDISKVDAVAISGDFAEPVVVTSGTGGCKVTRIAMTAKLGYAVPVVAVPTPTTSPTSA
jgi:hypothetical protein